VEKFSNFVPMGTSDETCVREMVVGENICWRNGNVIRVLLSSLIVLFYLAVSRGFYLWIYETIGRTPWTGVRPDARPLPTQHRETQTHIHAPSRIRTCDLNIRTTEDSTCIRPLGHWDRLIFHRLNYRVWNVWLHRFCLYFILKKTCPVALSFLYVGLYLSQFSLTDRGGIPYYTFSLKFYKRIYFLFYIRENEIRTSSHFNIILSELSFYIVLVFHPLNSDGCCWYRIIK
jgi:hypothetical protein